MNTIYNMYKRGLCALCLLTTVGTVSYTHLTLPTIA